MDLDAIAVFVKVVESGSFSAAARALAMPKTTVSAKVAALERRLGAALIRRTTRKLHVTEAGALYFQHCANAMREVELAEAALQSAQGQPNGLLRVTAPVDIGHALLPAVTRAYLERYPGTSVELIVTNRVVDLVGEGVDLAVRAGVLRDSSLIARRFFDVSGRLWAAPAYLAAAGRPAHPDDLAGLRFVDRTGDLLLRLTDGEAEVEVAPAGRVAADDFETIRALAIEGEGVAFLPEHMALEAAAAGTLAPVLPGWRGAGSGACYFVYAGSKYASPAIQGFIETALEVVARRA